MKAIMTALAVSALAGPALAGTKLDCKVVWVNDDLNSDLFEEGFGSVYDISDEGYFNADSDGTDVYSETLGADTYVRLGQYTYATDEGAAIEPVKGEGYQGLLVTTKVGGKETFEIRRFESSGLGVVLYRKNAKSRVEQFATLDCRADYTAPERD